LDETNLTFEIGGNAGMIWNALFTNGELDTTHISRLIQKVDDGYVFVGKKEDLMEFKKKKN